MSDTRFFIEKFCKITSQQEFLRQVLPLQASAATALFFERRVRVFLTAFSLSMFSL